MNLARLYRLSLCATIGICLIAVAFQWVNVTIQPGLWYLAFAPAIFIPNIVTAVIIRKARKNATIWTVLAVINRPITEEEEKRLRKKGYQVKNMYVSGVRLATTHPDAALILYTDLMSCLDCPFDVEEVRSFSVARARRAVIDTAGLADEELDQLFWLHGDERS